MKALRTIGILVLVAVLILSCAGTVFAKNPHEVHPGKGPKFQGEKQGFSGNVTDVVDGNVTILTQPGSTVTVMLTEQGRYKIPRVMNKWGNLTDFVDHLEGNDLASLIDRRVVTQAGNVSGTWESLKLLLLPVPGLPPLHAHRTANVTEYNPWIEARATLGNITIEDVHGMIHTFAVDAETTYRPKELNGLPESQLGDAVVGHFVTVVVMGDPKVDSPVAKAVVVHRRMPEGWPTP